MIEVYDGKKLTGSYATIQDAVDAASEGDTIKLPAGTFNETVTVDKALSFEGAGAGSTIMDGSGLGGSGLHLVGDLGDKEKVEISGITFQNYSVAGIDFDDDATLKKLKITDSHFEDNALNGLRVGGDYDPVALEKAEIKDSSFVNNGDGSNNGDGDILFFQYYGDAKIEDVSITGGGTGDNGIQFRGDDGPIGKVQLKDVDIDGSYAKTGIAVYNYSDGKGLKFKDTNVTAASGWDKQVVIDDVGGKIDANGLDTSDTWGWAELSGNDGKNDIKAGDGAAILNGKGGDDKLKGGDGDDLLLGGDGDDKADGKKGDDAFLGGAGDDKIDGGKGFDVATYDGAIDDFDFTIKGHDKITITDLRGGSPEGTDKLKDVEQLIFTNGTPDSSDDQIYEVALGTLTSFDRDVTPDAIFGSGNTNGSYTVSVVETEDLSVELGLRGKLRFNASNNPENTFNSNGDGTYSFENDLPPTGFGFDSGSPTTPIWNFEWSINTDASGTTGNKLNDFIYVLELDGDPTDATDFDGFVFDPVNVPYADHSIGGNGTPNGSGTSASTPAEYAALIDGNNVAQNSWSYEFFNEPTDGVYLDQLSTFDPTEKGEYTIRLSAYDGGDLINRVSIDIIVDDFL
ncbi:MAG: hypothetical protein P1U75_12055 [Antarcticimicrobium sp.]|uniref:hypothetical protein n=1 Tax=Antarcticimicrobium sp. TaxID=2824147 RepID=UPI002623E8E2|nr:hypothetical protein [Antarcticimicrobium sp.]MDF1717388.1 hypothetical protein [Antarcticimicrobium sp.]